MSRSSKLPSSPSTQRIYRKISSRRSLIYCEQTLALKSSAMSLPSEMVSWRSVTLLLPVLLSVVLAAPLSTGLENANTNALKRREDDYMIGHSRKPMDPASKMKRRAERLARRANECKAKKPKLPNSCEKGEAKIDNKCQKCPDRQRTNQAGDRCDLIRCDKPGESRIDGKCQPCKQGDRPRSWTMVNAIKNAGSIISGTTTQTA